MIRWTSGGLVVRARQLGLPAVSPFDPTEAWTRGLQARAKMTPVQPMAGDAPRKEGCSRWVCISDTHGRHREIDSVPDGDVLIHAGDFTDTGSLK